MGLACSSSISKALGGDITLKKSKRGLTSFAFKIPVLQIFSPDDGNILVRNKAMRKNDDTLCKNLEEVIINQKLLKYVKKLKVKKVIAPKIKESSNSSYDFDSKNNFSFNRQAS